jgi:hypothetical protein
MGYLAGRREYPQLGGGKRVLALLRGFFGDSMGGNLRDSNNCSKWDKTAF